MGRESPKMGSMQTGSGQMSKDKRQVRLLEERRGDMVKGRRQVRYQEIRQEESDGE